MPFFGYHQPTGAEQMDNEQRPEADVLDIEDLEYNVGGAGAVESSDTQVNHGAMMVVNFFRAPVAK